MISPQRLEDFKEHKKNGSPGLSDSMAPLAEPVPPKRGLVPGASFGVLSFGVLLIHSPKYLEVKKPAGTSLSA